MNKLEAINKVVQNLNFETTLVEQTINEFIRVISTSIKEEDKTILEDFGTFDIKVIPERTGRHPVSQVEVVIPSQKEVVFRPSLVLKNLINNKD